MPNPKPKKKAVCKSCLGKGYFSYFSGTHGKDEFTGEVVGDPMAIRYYPCKECAGGKGPLIDKPLNIKDTGSYCTLCMTPKCEDGTSCKRWDSSHHWMSMCHFDNHHGAKLRKDDTVYYTSRWVGNGEPLEKPKCKLTLLGVVVLVGIGMLIGGLIW